MKQLPDLKYLRACFTYDAGTGTVTWKKRPLHHFVTAEACKTWNTRFAGTVAGWTSRYFRVTLDSQTYRLHRVIWKIMTGVDPTNTVDHKDTNKLNNTWSNLRMANETQQKWNRGKLRNNTSGHTGVSHDRRRSKWRAQIAIAGRQHYIGRFDTAEQAGDAYKEAARKLHCEFYNEGSQ